MVVTACIAREQMMGGRDTGTKNDLTSHRRSLSVAAQIFKVQVQWVSFKTTVVPTEFVCALFCREPLLPLVCWKEKEVFREQPELKSQLLFAEAFGPMVVSPFFFFFFFPLIKYFFFFYSHQVSSSLYFFLPPSPRPNPCH